jgi:hypothetical protein
MPKLRIIFERCKACGRKFGYDPDGHEYIDYLTENQPKWVIKVGRRKWYYCDDTCVDKHFKKEEIEYEYTPWWYYIILIGLFGYKKKVKRYRWTKNKKNPNLRFQMRLSKAFKLRRNHS